MRPGARDMTMTMSPIAAAIAFDSAAPTAVFGSGGGDCEGAGAGASGSVNAMAGLLAVGYQSLYGLYALGTEPQSGKNFRCGGPQP